MSRNFPLRTPGVEMFVGGVMTLEWQNFFRDIYSEGEWDPELEFGGASVGLTYSSRSGRFAIVANNLYVYTIGIVLTSKGTSVGAATISLPTTANSCPFSSMFITAGVTVVPPILIRSTGTSQVQMGQYNAGAFIAITDSDFANNSSFEISGFYFAP